MNDSNGVNELKQIGTFTTSKTDIAELIINAIEGSNYYYTLEIRTDYYSVRIYEVAETNTPLIDDNSNNE